MKYIIPAVIVISVGLITLLGYFVTLPQFQALRLVLTDWAVVLGGLAILVGVLNLILVNIRRVQSQAKGWGYSLITALAALLTFILGAGQNVWGGGSNLYEPGSLTAFLFNSVVFPAQAALAALVAVFLIIAAFRLMHSKPDQWSIIFLVAAVIVLIGWLPYAFLTPVNGFREWVIGVPVSGGARGILIGVALGTLTVGLRVITGIERPYKD